MRILALTRYGPLGASSRLRFYQFLPALRASDFDVDVSMLFGDDYVRALYARRKPLIQALRGYIRRGRVLLETSKYDVVWVEKELFPWLPALFEHVRGGAAVVVDYDDAIFHRYDTHKSAMVRRLLGRRIDTVMARADMVTAGNGYLAARAREAGCSKVELLPTVVDLERYVALPRVHHAGPVAIGWIGSPSTACYLQHIAPAIDRLARERHIDAVAVGARPDQVKGMPFRSLPWSETTEAEQVLKFDIGLMPLPDSPWERGKCGYKLIQYMACGLPVVASPVGVNVDMVNAGTNGLLATSVDDWYLALMRLVDNPDERFSMGMSGRAIVERNYSLQVQAPRLVKLLRSVADRGRGQ
jgi:glycosyltransferase involved in cell wall biosynthesis